MILLLTLLSVLVALALLLLLALYTAAIARLLDQIGGGPTSYLARIRLGVRAIERETGLLDPELSRLNQTLAQLRAALMAVQPGRPPTV